MAGDNLVQKPCCFLLLEVAKGHCEGRREWKGSSSAALLLIDSKAIKAKYSQYDAI